MYNYQAPPGQFGRPPLYGAPPGMAPPPGMGAPPGMSSLPPGVVPPQGPPGMAPSSSPARPGFPPNFQPPANLPDIDFNAKIIRMGTSGVTRPEVGVNRRDANTDSFNRNRAGLGMGMERGGDHDRKQGRDNMALTQQPTREELMRTIFVTAIPDGVSNDAVERILQCAGSLRRWTRTVDPSGKIERSGFAEYEDAESLETAIEVFSEGVEVPAKRVDPRAQNGEVAKAKLQVLIDDNSRKYSQEWKERRNEGPDAASFRVDTAREELGGVLASLFRPSASADGDGDLIMQDAEVKADPLTGEIVTINFAAAEDELSDIPAEMRETVAAEIANFRDRSNRKDMERLRLEEERETLEARTSRINRLASPPVSAPTGPAGGANGIPLGPRGDRGVQGAPSGPKGFQGSHMHKDHENGVNGAKLDVSWILLEDEDTDASDEELERRRTAKSISEKEDRFLEKEASWFRREKSKMGSEARQKGNDEAEKKMMERQKRELAERLKKWNDDEEAIKKNEAYYQDRSIWLRQREMFRTVEAEKDDFDRQDEEREKNRDKQIKETNRGSTGGFRPAEAEVIREPTRFKMSLGAAVQSKAQQIRPTKRTAAEVENLLEDEEDYGPTTKLELKPIKFDTAAEVAVLTEDERKEAAQQLAREIPTDSKGLWNWSVAWDFAGEDVLERLRPLIEKKILEYLGVQEQMLVDMVEQHIRNRGTAQELVAELSEALDEDAEAMVKKIWRILIYFSEADKRGLST